MVHNGYGADADHDDDFYCQSCGASFDDPVERERYQESGLPGLAGKLDSMDADDVGKPMTDGGVLPEDLQIVTRLRGLADDIEVHGLEDVDVDITDGQATIVETVDLDEPEVLPDGGLGGDR
jgi:hypothetical protein